MDITPLRALEEEDCYATAAEQVVLSRFVGSGAGDLTNNLFPSGQDGFRADGNDLLGAGNPCPGRAGNPLRARCPGGLPA